MIDASIEKRRRLSRTAIVVLWGAGLILFIVANVVAKPESKSLSFALRIATLVFWIGGLILMVRHKTKERKWRETGKWE